MKIDNAARAPRIANGSTPPNAAGDSSLAAPISGPVTTLFAFACGLAVAGISLAQPLLDLIAAEFGLAAAHVGIVVTVTQIGYALGLLLIVPLGDLLNRRRLIVGQMVLSSLALLAAGTARSGTALLTALAAVGLLAVVTQVLVAYAATLAAPARRGRVVGVVTSGVVLGIVGARSIAGLLADLAGWRSAYLLSAALTLIVAAALWQVLPRREAIAESMSYLGLLRSAAALFVHEPLLRVRAGIAALSFAAFSVLWTSMVLPLRAAPHALSHTAIGLFGLAGVAGALAASRAGHAADRGRDRQVTTAALALLVLAWLPIALAGRSLWAFAAGVVVLDFAVQTLHVTGQTLLYATRPQARSRLAAGYMVFYSIGSGIGAIASTAAYARAGWIGVCLLGAAISSLALLFWAVASGSPHQADATSSP